MQDRFKFRVWQTELKEPKMKYNSGLVINNNEIVEDGCVFMQSTGLKDKNGKLIYEGDIVKIWKFSKDLRGKDKRIIKWNNARCGFRLYTIDNYKRGIEFCPQSMVNVTTIEVIGNIYQDTELLKEES